MSLKSAPIFALLALSVVACGSGRPSEAMMESVAAAPAPPMMEREMAQEMAFDDIAPGAGGSGAENVQQYIAYSYSLGMRLPVTAIEPVMQSHIDACNAAGPARCIVTNSWLNAYSDSDASATLQIRATPDWIDGFMNQVDQQAEDAKGEITNRQTTAEDLTATIIDTDARLKAQQILQQRLEKLLADRDGELGDILATERELARVNGEIDSLKSNIKALRQRVSMSALSVSYETKRPAVSQSAFKPLASAFGDFFYNLASALGAVITFFAVGLPWMILAGVFGWIWLKLIWPRLRKKKA